MRVCHLEDGGTVNLPKPDRGENARGGRASSLLNYIMFGSSEEDEDYNDIQSSHERHHSDDFIRTHKLGKSRSFSQAPYENDFQQQQQQLGLLSPKVKPNSPPGGVIRRLRSLSLSRKPPPDLKSQTPESSPEGRAMPGSLSPVKKMRPLSSNRKQDLLDYEIKSTTCSLQKDMLSEPLTNNSDQSRRFSMGPIFLRKYSSDNQELNPNSQDKKIRRKTFSSIFSGREKPKYSSSSPSPRLYPHLETEIDDSKISPDDLKLKPTNFGDSFFSSEDENESNSNGSDTISRPEETDVGNLSGDNLSVDNVTHKSNSPDYPTVSTSRKSLSKNIEVSNDASSNTQKDQSIMSMNDMSQKITETDSVRSVKSLPPTPTSLYRPDSLGPLNLNQQKLMDFLLDFQSRIFCCYRKEFPPIEPAFHTTDTGWGCMHRTGQSLLAQGFLWVLLGRDWRLHNQQTDFDILIYRKILRWFTDGPELEQYYSIHNIARAGISLDKKIGDWFGPATIAHALKRLSLTHKECPLAIYVPTDNTIYLSEVINTAIGEHDISDDGFSDQKPWKPVLILLSVRLGTDKFNPSYSDNLKTLFTFPQFLGIAGGRPGRSLYFIAIQDDELLYLDPHFVRPAISLNKVTEFPIEDYHSTIVRAMDISEMDPSMLLGFLCQNSQDFDNFRYRMEKNMNSQFPLFTILDMCPVPGSWPRKKSLSDISLSDRTESNRSPSIEAVDDVDDDDDVEEDIITHEEGEEDDCDVSAKEEEDDDKVETIFKKQENLENDNDVSIVNKNIIIID